MKKKAVPGSPSCFFCLDSSQHDNSGFFISLPLYHQNVNLWKMSIVYPFVQVPLAQIIWYHHISMFPKVKDNIPRAFYIPNNFADTLPPLKLPFMNSCNMHIIIQRRLLSCAISKRLWRLTNTMNKILHCNFGSGMNTKYLMSSCLSGF